jgi:predicted ATPase/signal transduction histidine kinase
MKSLQHAARAATKTSTGQPQVPGRLYGRDLASRTLLAAFNQSCGGSGRVQLLPGRSGVGKTALVNEMREPVQRRNGYFLSGKFNQYQQDVPYFAIRQALTELCRQIGRDDNVQRQHWKTEMLQAVGGLGQLLVDLVPELESLIDKQAPVADIGPFEAHHRFVELLRKFLAVVCRPEHPVVLFIDDWQWADAASLDLLTNLQVDTTLRYLLVIVSYRDDEVDSTHPLAAAVEELRRQAVPMATLEVVNLTLEDTRALLADTLPPAIENLDALAERLHRHAAGNPFFTLALIGFLFDNGLLGFDSANARWCWSVGKVAENRLPSDVIDLFAGKLDQMEPDCRRLLSRAACLGNRFDLETLAIIDDCRADECQSRLEAGVAQGLVLPMEGAPAGTYVFLHDRVQQAAYGLIRSDELAQLRLEIGRRLVANLSPQQLSGRLFQVVDHLNAGYSLIHDRDEQIRVVMLNVRAGRRAHSAIAYRTALKFQRAAARFLELPRFAEQLWEDHHDVAMQLYLTWAQGEFLEGDRNESERCIRDAVANAASSIERADALTSLIVQFTLQARYPEAIAVGREALAEFGITLPAEEYEVARDSEIDLVRQELKARPVAELIDLPVMTDPQMRMAAKILITMGPPSYRSHQRLWSVIVPKVVSLTLRYGHIPQVGYSHTAFGGLLGWVDNDYATAKEFGDLATRLMTSVFDSPSDQSVFYLMIGSSLRHWSEHLRSSSRDYALAYETGSRSGNLQYAAYAFGHNMYCRFYQGTPLPELILESQRSLDFSHTRLNQWAIDLLEGGLKIFASLNGSGSDLEDDEAWEENYLGQVDQHHNIQVKCIYQELRAHSLLFLGQFERALAWSDKTAPLIYTVGTQGLLPWPEHVFARSLIIAALYPGAAPAKQAIWHVELEQALAQLAVWSRTCPANFAHKHALAAAEMARLDNRVLAAMRQYHQAAAAAAAGGFVQWEGLANERAAMLLETCGQGQMASAYWQQAYGCYSRWGATRKLQAMETARRTGLAASIHGIAKPCVAEDVLDQELLSSLQGRQLDHLRAQPAYLTFDALRKESDRKSRELAKGAENLRLEIAERKKAEAEIRSLNADLEDRVRQRTAELEMTNQALTLAKDDAEAANRAKSTFLANMSHELRTPMNAIMGMTDLVLRQTSDPTQIEQLGKVKAASNHLLHVINDILDISKIEAERLQLDHVDFQVGQILENVLSLLGHKANEKGLKLLMDLEVGVPSARFNGDPVRLAQILINLTGNALKFTDAGAITLRCRRVADNPEDVLLRWEVADTGIGIEPDAQKRLFSAFEQADNSMTRKYGGTGLGLAISKRLVQLMGGEIGVESTPGQGSTFWFTVRLGKSTDAVPPAPTFTGKSANKRLFDTYTGTRILLAEDEPVNQEVSRGLLEDVGLMVDLAEDGLQALELAKKNTYALILMDMQMPHMNGVDATMAIRALPAYAHTPILAMTANAFDEDRQRCFDAGMNDYISKPVDPDRLYETLLGWLVRSTPRGL